MKRTPRSRAKLFPTPEDAENAFYEAFERADLPGMMAVWAETEDIVCIHPQGPRLVGFTAVRDSWMQIFSGGSQLRVRTTDVRIWDGQSVCVRNVIEMLAPPGRNEPTHTVLATNVYELTDVGWRMTAHHASPPADSAPAANEEPSSSSHTLH
jgi:uncharacterized protein (TIGR02246 family)